MGHKHDKAELLDAALEAALADGLSQLTFGRLARRLGISDRVVVYYFPSKDDLVREVLGLLAARLQATLAEAFEPPARDHVALLRTAWPVLARREVDPWFALFFEANGLAAAGREPYRSVVPAFVEAWIGWASSFVEGPPKRRRTEAETAIALVDGLLLMRLLGGAEAAERVARRLGISAPRASSRSTSG